MEDKTSIAAEVQLKSTAPTGESLSVCFLPHKGMNFISFKKGNYEALDQSTMSLFEERYAGLGAMIGPHFHHRKESLISPIKDPSLFPHLANIKGKEPFSHGIGRYAPWKVESIGEDFIKAVLSGDDMWNSIALKELEGQNFTMCYEAKLNEEGLAIHLSVKSDTESVVGLHTYYAIGGKGKIISRVKDHYVDKSEFKPIPSTWNYQTDHTLIYPLDQETDFGFHPFPDPLHGEIAMESETHTVRVQYWCDNEENSFQLWHPKDASFVCIEPLSAKDPRKPKLTVTSLKILISIL